ncbi:MAG TPA: class I SAM-dependent methyltransferase [Alteraurantiacibacter sp.]
MSGFLQRSCPSCGHNRFAEIIRSEPRAETLSLEELKPFWAGFHETKLFFSYHRCAACGLLFAPRFFDDDQLAELYSDLAPNMDIVPSASIEATQRSYFEAAAKAAALEGGYLEIGPDVGHVAAHAARTGCFDAFWLFEPNLTVHPHLAAATAPFPTHILSDMTDLSPVPDGSVGVAAMIHVLDHLLDPVSMLRQIHGKLRPGGTLMIVTHNEGSLLRKVMGRRWPPFCLQHPQLFSPASITAMLRRSGFASATVDRSTNYFPVDFLVKQAGKAIGLKFDRLPAPKASLGLKLGNMITMAKR